MEKEQLTPLQSRLLVMMEWFHKFCEDNNLRYYVLGGTMLGAARHQGFIPWDDDIDVGMPRKDYKKLAELLGDNIVEGYQLETPYTEATDFCYPYSKFFDTTTTLVENYKKPFKRGIFLDIFPLDGLADTEQEAKNAFQPILRTYNFFMTRVVAIRKERKWYKNLAVLLSQAIPKMVIDNRKLRVKMDQMIAGKDFDALKWGGNLYGNWGFKEIMPREIYGEPTIYQFENLNVYGVEKYDEYLKHMYGDWKKLPPKEKQITHHDYLEFSLEKSYK